MRQRKNFVSIELPKTMESELGDANQPNVVDGKLTASLDSARTPHIKFPENATDTRYFYSVKFLGKRFDDVVLTTFAVIARLLDSAIKTGQQTYAYTTLVCFCTMGLVHLYAYCEELIASKTFSILTSADITEEFILGFEEFLQKKPIKSQRHILTRVKKILTQREFNVDPSWFPVNSFAGRSPEKPPRSIRFTPREHMALKTALANEVRTILSNEEPLNRDDLCVCLLTIADKTGANLQPLLELDTSAITAHPFNPHKRILNLYKRRNNSTHPIPLIPGSVDEEEEGPVPKFVEAPPFIEKLINTIISSNERARSSSKFPFRVFVSFTARTPNENGKILTKSAINDTIKNLISKYCLKSEDGRPLVVNYERIRKTWINNAFELSDHDPYITAALANQGIRVSNDHYLQAPPDAKQKHSLMGEVRVDELLNYDFENTLIAKCSDIINGERAPKDGGFCVQVFGCFKCSNFVVTGDDLYRLYSFYLHCLRLRGKLGARAWKKTYGHITKIITKEILPKFDEKLVEAASEKARNNPHPAWKH